MWKQLAAHLNPFFRFTVHILTIRDKKYRILSFCTETELRASRSQKALVQRIGLWQISLTHSPAHSCSLNMLLQSLLGPYWLAAPLPRCRTLSRSGHADDYV